MAKKKRRSRGRRKGKKRSSPKSDRAMPAGLLVGATMGVSDAIIDAKPTQIWGYTDLNPLERVLWIARASAKEMMTPDTYTPVLMGALVSASPKIPLVRLVAKPADRAIRRLSKGKVSL